MKYRIAFATAAIVIVGAAGLVYAEVPRGTVKLEQPTQAEVLMPAATETTKPAEPAQATAATQAQQAAPTTTTAPTAEPEATAADPQPPVQAPDNNDTMNFNCASPACFVMNGDN